MSPRPARRAASRGGPARPAAFTAAALRRERRDAILRQAAKAFNKQGFANTSMDDVARELAITKPTLYRYFASKHAILLACHELAMGYAERAIEAATGAPDGLARILTFARENLRGIVGALGTFPVIADVDSLLPADRRLVTARRKRISAWFRRTLAEGMADGTIQPGDPNLIALYCFGVFNWVPLWYRDSGPSSPDEIVETYVALFRRTLAASPVARGSTDQRLARPRASRSR